SSFSCFFFSSRRRHTRSYGDWSSDVCSSDLGEYEFPARVSVLQALEIIAAGRMVKHRLMVPEGLTTAEVLALVRDAPALDGDVGPPPGEGELLPDTYVYSYGETRQEVIERMRRAMAHMLAQMWKERRHDLPL